MEDFVRGLQSHMQIIVNQVVTDWLKTVFSINFDTNLRLDTGL